MSKYNSFEELKNARLKAYNAMREGDVLGFLDQHTGFYPDPAHFIYELLQNAEDMEATEVSFKLFPDKLIFEHNGTKRDFILDDIDAITNKGKSPKADDPTQIGKFGMGFKAVYVYTNTPEIHSGEFNFRIENVIVPNNEDVPKTAKANLTQFIFPFDNPNKSAKIAVKEIIEDGFEKLDETSLLFLTHIKTIRYCQPDGGAGYVSIENKISNIYFICAITVKKPNSEKIVTYWAKFSDNCPIMVSSNDSRNKTIKAFPVSIAYRLNKNENNFSLDSSLVGKVCLFFPTEMDSLLHFHINAPFASTVARDVILSVGEDGEANTKLIRKLADLTAESLHWFKKAKMLDYAAYSTLPSLRDYNNQPDSRYKIFASRIKEEFENAELFIADNGNHYALKDVFKATNKDIKTILPTKFVEKIYHKSWIPTVPSVTRVEYFIDQFKITEYSIEDFIDSLEENSNCFDELFSEQTNVEYFKTLYYQFSQSKERIRYSFIDYSPSRNEILSDVRFILCEDKKLYSAKDNIYLRTDYQPKHYLKNPIYVDISLKDTDSDRKIKQFLKAIGIQELVESADINAGLSNDNESVLIVWIDILKQFDENPESILQYKNKEIFLAEKPNSPEIFRVCATDCCWSKEVAFYYEDKYIFAEDHYNDIKQHISKIKEIFVKLGGKAELKIVEKDLYPSYPLLDSLKRERERCNTCVRTDYGIEGFDLRKLEKIKLNALIKEPLILWKLVLRYNNRKLHHIVYQANSSAKVQDDLDSSLVYYLKRTAWIPTKSGTYKCPYELTDEDLLDDFKYEKPSLLLSAISEKPNDNVEQLKRAGIEDENTLFFAGCNSDEQSLAREYIERLRLQKQKSGKSLTELAVTSDREQLPEGDEINEDIAPRRIKNFERRKLKLEKEFDEREEIPTSIKKLRFVTEKPNDDEKTFIRNEYHARCQLCGSDGILTAKGKRYFEAVNIFNTAQLDESLKIKFDLGWNTLSLCPNCAAKFKYSQLKISGFIAQVESIDIPAEQSEFIEISITLENTPAKISFTHTHLLALQVAIQKIKQIEALEST